MAAISAAETEFAYLKTCFYALLEAAVSNCVQISQGREYMKLQTVSSQKVGPTQKYVGKFKAERDRD
jgi:hypothetical protein